MVILPAMLFRQVYLGCLAQASYLIGDQDEAVVVDPRRDIGEYLDLAQAHGMKVRHAIATHTHADFVAGLRELAVATGARVLLGPGAGAGFDHQTLADGAQLRVGRLRVSARSTPGHTFDSISLLVEGGSHEPRRLLTGDTLFIGDVGRPDLVASRGGTPQEMAGLLFDSLQRHVLPLEDDVEVHPGHGAGSACGKNIGSETSSTVGLQRRNNPMLQIGDREAFVRELVRDLMPAPRYFAHAAALNRSGPRLLKELPELREVEPRAATATLVDVRPPAVYGAGHPLGAINIGLSGQFEHWCGTLLPPDERLVIVAGDPKTAEQARLRLARIGYEQVAGWIQTSAFAERRTQPQVTASELAERLRHDRGWQVVDVRRPREYESGRVPGSVSAPLHALAGHPALANLDRARPTAVICQTGYRSSIACRLLSQAGFEDLVNIAGGTSAWIEAGLPVER
jgi:glyoxylase-like metal-dependent hydrolase (beta-lactamase superfamily II)